MNTVHSGSLNDHHLDPERSLALRRAAKASFIGNFIEWFDYASYGYLATVIGLAFFPDADKPVQLMSTYAVFAMSFILRPIGAVVWGAWGDRWGRRWALSWSILIMSGSTFFIGLLPTYSAVGVAGAVSLLLLRMIQGFSASGEYAGAGTFLAEYAPPSRRGIYTSLVPASTACGLLAGSLMVTGMFSVLSDGAMNTWGWRIPFLLAGPLGLIGRYIRVHLEDSPAYQEMRAELPQAAKSTKSTTSIFQRMGRHRRGIVISLVAVLVHATAFYAILAYLPSYIQKEIALGKRTAIIVVACGIFAYICAVSFAVRVTDQRGRRRSLIVALLLFILPESIQELLSNHRRDTAITFGVSCLNAVAFYMLLSYMPTYVHEELGFSQDTATLATSIMLVVYIGSIFVMGHLSDSFGRRQMLITACVAFLVLTIPLFLIMTRVAGMFTAVVLCQIVFAIALTANDGTLATFLAESFPTNVRYSGFALSFNGANAILGGTTPFIVTWLIKVTGSPLAPAVYLTVIALFAMVAIFMSRTIHGSELTESNCSS